VNPFSIVIIIFGAVIGLLVLGPIGFLIGITISIMFVTIRQQEEKIEGLHERIYEIEKKLNQPFKRRI